MKKTISILTVYQARGEGSMCLALMFMPIVKMAEEWAPLCNMHSPNRDLLIESEIYTFSCHLILPLRSHLVDKRERLGWKLIFQNNCYSLCPGDSSVSKALSYYSCRLSNLPALWKYMKGAQPLASTTIKVVKTQADTVYSEAGWMADSRPTMLDLFEPKCKD